VSVQKPPNGIRFGYANFNAWEQLTALPFRQFPPAISVKDKTSRRYKQRVIEGELTNTNKGGDLGTTHT
jgi:hypothetical protein